MLHLSRRVLRLVAMLFAFSMIVSACGDDDAADGDDESVTDPDSSTTTEAEDDAGDPQYGGKIILGLEAETNNWLPGTGSFASSGVTVAMSIYDPLMVLNAEGENEPNLAESLEPNDDLTEWTMTLREGVTFHDGSPLDAENIKWNFDTLHNVDGALTKGQITAAGLVEVEVVDDLTVIWRLSETNAAFPDLLRGVPGWPTSQEAYESLGPDVLAEQPVGTGPFVFSQWSRDESFIATRNENYWRTDEDGNPLPYLDEVEFRPISDEDSRVQSLASDTVQVVSTLRGSTIKAIQELEEGGGFAGNLWVGNTSGASIFNTLVPPVDDVRLRRAMALAGDAEAVAVVLGDDGLVPITTSFFSVDSPWFSEEVSAGYPGGSGRDLDAAIELVEEYRADPDRSDGRAPGDPIEVTYNCPPDPSLIEVSQLVQQLWGEAGIVVNLETVEQATHIGNAVGTATSDPPWAGDYMINCWRAGAGEGDPLASLQNFFGPVAETPGNFTNFTHPDIDAALNTMKTSADFAERYAAAEEIGKIANEFVPLTWGVGTATYVGWRDDIQGIATWKTPSGSDGSGTVDARVILHQVWLSN